MPQIKKRKTYFPPSSTKKVFFLIINDGDLCALKISDEQTLYMNFTGFLSVNSQKLKV